MSGTKEITADLTRREFLVGAGLLTFAAGCGTDSGPSEEIASADTRTIEHAFGSTEVNGRPERVVSVGMTDQDSILALGVVPVGIRDWFGEQPNAVWPWAREALGDAKPEVLAPAELDLEQIAALEPDLIIGLSTGLTEEQYENLSRIAPTVPQLSPGITGPTTPWQTQTRTIARALGLEENAEPLIAEAEGRFEEARSAHPEFEGASAAIGDVGVGEPIYYVYDTERNEARFLSRLGFEVPERFESMMSEGGVAQVSKERFDLVGDLDLLVWYGAPDSLDDAELYQDLAVRREGRAVFLDPFQASAGAIAFSSVLSLPYALDTLVPRFVAAVDGDPETKTG